jgi:hypothetical protein
METVAKALNRLSIACICILFFGSVVLAQTTITEGFETGSISGTSTLSSGVWTFYNASSNSSAHTGSVCVKFSSSSSTPGYAITPVLNTVDYVSFWAKAGSAGNTITVMKSDNGGTFTNVATPTLTSSWAQYTVPISDICTNVQIKIMNTPNSGTSESIDDVTLVTLSSASMTLSATSLTDFGQVAAGTASASFSYTVSGSKMGGNINITASAGFQVSTNNSTFTSVVSLVPNATDSSVASTTIYVRFVPTSGKGATTGTVTHTSAGALTKTINVSGTALSAEPTIASAVSIGSVTGTSLGVTFSGGNGAKHLVLARANSAVTWIPTDAVTMNGASTVFSSAAMESDSSRLVYAGTGTSVTVTGLAVGTTYYVSDFEYNADTTGTENYLTSSIGTASATTSIVPGMACSATSLSFDQVVVNGVSAELSYTLSGIYLSPESGSISILAPSGFKISTTSGASFTSSISLSYSSSALPLTTIYVRFEPTNKTAYSGSITNAGGGASANVSVSGTGADSSILVIKKIYCSPSGNDATGDGSISNPFYSLSTAVALVNPGDFIYMRGGTYYYSAMVELSNKLGSPDHRYYVLAYPGEHPVLNYSNWHPASEAIRSNARGIRVDSTAGYWYIKGLEICYAPDNGVKLEGHHVTFDLCIFHNNGDSGLQIGTSKDDRTSNPDPEHEAAYNVILNCESYLNFDSVTDGENADGFSCKCYAGKGNFFYGCRSYHNADDGWDCFQTDYQVTFENCWSFHNGDPTFFGLTSFAGDGNGFKLGGASTFCYMSIRHCIAMNCNYGALGGFAYNDNTAPLTVQNCTAIRCGRSYNFQEAGNVITNCIDYDAVRGAPKDLSSSTTSTNDTWSLGITVDSTYFTSTSEDDALAPRQADGGLPLRFGRLATGSAPDLGAYEYGIASWPTVPDTIFTYGYSISSTAVIGQSETPRTLLMVQNYPNPFNPTTKITFSVSVMGKTTLKIYDVIGREVAELFNGQAQPGQTYIKEFNASRFASGVYFSVVQSGSQHVVSKMLLMK